MPPGRSTRPRSRENRTRYVVLGMLTLGPMNGYELRQAIARSVGHFWQESFGQLYPALRALAGDGLVRVVGAGGRRGASRRRHGAAYEVTACGREALAAWLAKPPMLEPARNELLLKVFFASAVPPEVTLRNLAIVGEHVRGELAQLEELASRWSDVMKGCQDAPFWRLTLDFGLLFMRTALGWLANAQQVIGSTAREVEPAGAARRSAGAGRGRGKR